MYYTIYLRVYNKYGECEHRQTFNARTKAAVSMLAGKWCVAGWGKGWRDDMLLTVRINQFDNTIISWDIR